MLRCVHCQESHSLSIILFNTDREVILFNFFVFLCRDHNRAN